MITIPTVDKHSSVSGLMADLQPVLDELAVAFPDHFAPRPELVVAPVVAAEAPEAAAAAPAKPKRIRKPKASA